MQRYIRFLLIFSLALCMFSPLTAYAVGEGNIDGGGGTMGEATEHGRWSSGDDGVRVTVVRSDDHTVITTPIDITNKTPDAAIYHFGKVSKIQYNNGAGLSPVQGGYSYKNPGQSLPRIISSSGNTNIDAVKSYFTDEQIIRSIADTVGMDFDILTCGEYKLLLEPVAYYEFEGVMIASTATEAALYDEQLSGLLRKRMPSLTHKNLPLSMFLEIPDLGYPAWSGSTADKVTNSDIKSSLGLGIVRFTEQPEQPIGSSYDYVYRVGTEVITAIEVKGGQSDPDNPASVRFAIGGETYHVGNVYYPEGDSQLAWVRWTTPDTPQDITITVSGSAQGTIHCRIEDLDKNPPPNPVADDRNDSFSAVSVPDREERTSASWSIWSPWWQNHWVWHSDYDEEGNDNGYWCDHGWWEFTLNHYNASLSSTMEIAPDTYSPTASASTLKSGYGLNQVVTAGVTSSQSSATTPAQNAVSYFPEFGYETYWRLLEKMSSGYSARFEFQKNEYSTYGNRTHFTPIWYPDGGYTVNTWLIDCWTPVGMLSMNLHNTLTIRGDLWEDWHIAPLSP